MDDEHRFEVTAIFGFMTGQPLVNVTFGPTRGQVPPSQAREMALLLFEAAEAAESDACVLHVLTDMGMPRESAAQMLVAMRQKRAELNADETPAPDPQGD